MKFHDWLQTIEQRLDKHAALCTFGMLKIMKIYRIMMDQNGDETLKMTRLVLEVHFMFCNHEEVFDNLLKETKVLSHYLHIKHVHFVIYL